MTPREVMEQMLVDGVVDTLNGGAAHTFSGTTATTSTAASAPPLTRESIHRAMQKIREFERVERFAEAVFPALQPYQRDMLRWTGVPMRENALATSEEPVRRHKKRRNQTEAYHRRIQKKWTKRFGTRHVPAAYMLNLEACGLGHGRAMVVHPDIARRIGRVADRSVW